MPETFEALAVVVLALLPGALYTWAFEGMVGRWGAAFSDRVLRFVGTSAGLHVLIAPLTYWLWARYVEPGTIASGDPLPWGLWAVVAGYVAVPYGAGYFVGTATKQRRRWAQVVTGRNPAPRAWDNFFTDDPEGWIRLKLKSGPWVGGAFTTQRSYAAGYPEEQDLYLAEVAAIDPETGTFSYEDDGTVRVLGSSMLLRWDEVEYLEFFEG